MYVDPLRLHNGYPNKDAMTYPKRKYIGRSESRVITIQEQRAARICDEDT